VGNSHSIDLVIVPTSYQAYVHGLEANRNAQWAVTRGGHACRGYQVFEK
jgi:hypothetical protein